MSKAANLLYEFGPFRLDPRERRLLRDGEPVPLTPKAFDTLLILVRHSGRLLEKDELMRLIWSDAVVEEGNLNRNIYLLRKVLGDDPQYIETVPKSGFRFVAPVQEVGEEETELILHEHTRACVVVEETADRRPDLPRFSSFPFALLPPSRRPLAPSLDCGAGGGVGRGGSRLLVLE